MRIRWLRNSSRLKDYYLYKDKVAFKPQNTETSIEKISLPQGTIKSDVTFGQVEVFHQPFEAIDVFETRWIIK